MSIYEVLEQIRSNDGTPFVLQFVRATGKAKGSIKTVRVLPGRSAGSTAKKTERKMASLKESYKLLLNDLDNRVPVTPFISHLTQYNGFTIKHY